MFVGDKMNEQKVEQKTLNIGVRPLEPVEGWGVIENITYEPTKIDGRETNRFLFQVKLENGKQIKISILNKTFSSERGIEVSRKSRLGKLLTAYNLSSVNQLIGQKVRLIKDRNNYYTFLIQ